MFGGGQALVTDQVHSMQNCPRSKAAYRQPTQRRGRRVVVGQGAQRDFISLVDFYFFCLLMGRRARAERGLSEPCNNHTATRTGGRLEEMMTMALL